MDLGELSLLVLWPLLMGMVYGLLWLVKEWL